MLGFFGHFDKLGLMASKFSYDLCLFHIHFGQTKLVVNLENAFYQVRAFIGK
jgi:hypothetical protein